MSFLGFFFIEYLDVLKTQMLETPKVKTPNTRPKRFFFYDQSGGHLEQTLSENLFHSTVRLLSVSGENFSSVSALFFRKIGHEICCFCLKNPVHGKVTKLD